MEANIAARKALKVQHTVTAGKDSSGMCKEQETRRDIYVIPTVTENIEHRTTQPMQPQKGTAATVKANFIEP